MERRRLEQVLGTGVPPGAGTKSEWDLFDAILDKRRQRRRQRRSLQRWQEGDKEADAAEGEGFRRGGGGGSGGTAREGRGTEAGGEGVPPEARRHRSLRPDHRLQLQHQRQRRRKTASEDQQRNDGKQENNDDDKGKASFWEGPGGWNGPVAVAAERNAGVGGSGEGVGGGTGANGDGSGGDGGVEIGIPTFSEVLDALKGGIWNAPTAFRPAVSLCGQSNSPFDSIIPFERLQVICCCSESSSSALSS